jgi:membrane protease YdiL (CAAX protease family)
MIARRLAAARASAPAGRHMLTPMSLRAVDPPSAVARSRAGPLAQSAVAAAGLALLLLRATAWRLPAATGVLLGGYLALAAAGAWAAGRQTRGPLPWPAALAVGLAAVAAVTAMAGPAPPARAGAAAAALGLAAAVAEEALFRGALYGLLERAGPLLAVAGSALAFALVHVPFYGTSAFPVDLGAGLLFAWQRQASGRWTVPAATHAAANLLVVIVK